MEDRLGSGSASDPVTVFVAKRFHTMNPDQPHATAVAVDDDRIVAVGSMSSVTNKLDGVALVVDKSFEGEVVLPGLIDQHLHPILAASTLATEVISTEDWVLPERIYRAATSQQEYRQRLREADAALQDPTEWLFSWGYHRLWHGELSRGVLDEISTTRPIGIWQRSCHEFYLNSAAIEALGITEETMQGHGLNDATIDLANGHWWENGFFTVLMRSLSPVFLTPERLIFGLNQMVTYLHQNGVTAFNEPGINLFHGLWDLYESILGSPETPFASYFMVNARSQAEAGMDIESALRDSAEQIASAPGGKVSYFADQVKLFADGAIISQLMQMRDPYLDDQGMPDHTHHGEWLMTPEILETWSKAYWDAGYQLHVHVNGDLGLDAVLDMLERRLAENPRPDHRTVIVHFANSTEDQVDRIAELGAIVSANPYYPVGFADKYADFGLGPQRADSMVRSKSVLDRKIPLSFHSDLPMGPSDPLSLMWCAVNRRTQSGRIAAPDQRIGVHDALRAVTIEAAYSWRREHELGSLEVGKMANFTVVDADPYLVDPMDLDKVGVIGTVFGGRWFPVPGRSSTKLRSLAGDNFREGLLKARPLPGHSVGLDGPGCSCEVSRHLIQALGWAA